MGHRRITDERGQPWDVWDVCPQSARRRLARAAPPDGEERRRWQRGMVLPPDLRDGWLAFQSDAERRRLSPIPDGWEELPDAELLRLLRRAVARGKPRRLIE